MVLIYVNVAPTLNGQDIRITMEADMWWAGPWMFIAPLLFVICLGMMFFMMRGCMPHWMMRGGNHPDHNPRRALDILEERFAKGEIGQAEFEERRRALSP